MFNHARLPIKNMPRHAPTVILHISLGIALNKSRRRHLTSETILRTRSKCVLPQMSPSFAPYQEISRAHEV